MNDTIGNLALANPESPPAGQAVAVRSGPWLGAVVRSVYETQDEILAGIMRLYCPGGFDADLTYGNGQFWKTLPRPRLCYDITPLHDGVQQADSALLPLTERDRNPWREAPNTKV